MPTPLDDPRHARLLGLALAKGWIQPGQITEGGWPDLLATGTLGLGQAESLERELDRGMAHLGQGLPEDEAPTSLGVDRISTPHGGGPNEPADPSTIFSASWIRAWAHFEDLVLIAEGGMGRIFRARDTRLRRKVALKMLRREDPDLQRRFLREAELQARVSHPNVCRIYEAGEWRGQAFIAMEHLAGDTLKAASKGMGQAELLRLMIQVCEGVHAAHEENLIHRDLKPTNLMVAMKEDPPRAVVLDFGLARPAQPTGLTQSGVVMGTVHYMSPEQARGDDRTLDRRTDIYALGITLYELLSGNPPFYELSGLEAISKILSEEPPSLAKVADVPRDLDTVVMKCLEKDPFQRYDTARALGDELRRVADAEPILARAISGRERAQRWARKNRALVMVGAAGLVATLAFGGVALRERLRASARAEYAQRFGQEAERIEALARYLKLAPAHDLGPERKDLEARAEALGLEVQREKGVAEGPGAYALGRAKLALGEAEAARRLLERAQALGFDTPECRFALGRALVELHQRDLEATWRLAPEEARKEALARLQARASERIVPLLRSGARYSLVPLSFLEGQVALVSGRYEEALRQARAASLGAPWFFEAKVLEAQALLSLGLVEGMSERAAALLQAHGASLDALRMAPSDPEVVAIAGRIGVLRIRNLSGPTPEQDRLSRQVEDSVERLETLQPGCAQARLLKIGLLTAEAVTAQMRGRPGAARLRGALDLLTPLLQEREPSLEMLSAAMQAECYAAKFPEFGDPVSWLDRALGHARLAMAARPEDADLAQELTRVAVWRISEGTARGESPWAVFEPALASVLRALEANPQAGLLREGLGYLWGERAEYERTHGLDPRESLRQSRVAFEAVAALGPSFRASYGMANAALMRGQYELEERKGNPLPALLEAEQGYRAARTMAPYHAGPPANQVEVALWKAKALGAATPEGLRALRDGESLFTEAADRFPKVAALWLRGAQLAALGGDRAAARSRIHRAMALDPHSPDLRRAAKDLEE